MKRAFARHTAWIGTAALLAPATAHADDAASQRDPSVHGRAYTSHRQPGRYAFEGPGGWHGSPRHGFEVGAHWDRTWPPNGHPGFATGGHPGPAVGSFGPAPCGVRHPCILAPWPLGNLDIEVDPE